MDHVYEGQLRPRVRPEFAISRDAEWIDVAIVALILGALLFYQVLAQLAPILMLSGTAIMVLLRWDRLPRAFATSWPLLCLPALCAASAAWSDVPTTTLYYATLYTATALAGILIGSTLNRNAYIEGFFIAFALFSISCLLFGRWVGHNNGGVAFAGLVGSKNTMGDMAAVGVIVTLAFISLKLNQRKLVTAALASPFVLLLAGQLVLSKATGALIAGFAGSALLVMWVVSRRLEIQVRSALLAASVEMGAVLGKVPQEGRAHLRAYARDIGLAFQIADDLLDVTGDAGKAGKALRKDEGQGKQTFVTMMGVDKARDQARLLVDQAVAHLGNHGSEADTLRALARFIVERDR